MPSSAYRPLGLAALGLSLLAAAPMAQAQASKIDPQARTLLDEMVAAHLALSGVKATVVVQDYGAGGARQHKMTLSFRRPSFARVAIADKTGPLALFTDDGKALTVYSVRDKKYMRQDPPTGPGAIAEVLGQSQTLLATLLARPAVLTRILVRPGVSVAGAGAGIVNGVLVDVVRVTPPAHAGGPRLTLTLSIGRKDHLLRRLAESAPASARGGKSAHTETVTFLAADPRLTARDFAFTPPPGAKRQVQQAQPPLHDPRLVAGAAPFPFAAKDLSGRPLSLPQYKGKVVLMDFWATWCGPCVGEMPDVIAAYKKYHARGFDVVGISLDQDHAALTSFLKRNKMPWRQVFDGKAFEGAVPRRYGVAGIPFGLLVGRDGKIAAVEVHGPDLGPAIQKALAKRTAAR